MKPTTSKGVTTKALRFYSNLPRKTKTRGVVWYTLASDFAMKLSEKYGIDYLKVCAVIAATSPANEWENNKHEAEGLIFAHVNGLDYFSQSFRTYPRCVYKAIDILKSSDNFEQLVFGKVGYKTRNFYLNIANPESDSSVTIDRHILKLFNYYRIIQGKKEHVVTSAKQYRTIEEGLQKAAKKVGLLPMDLQAVLWLHQVGKKKRKERVQESFEISLPK